MLAGHLYIPLLSMENHLYETIHLILLQNTH